MLIILSFVKSFVLFLSEIILKIENYLHKNGKMCIVFLWCIKFLPAFLA